MTEYTYSGDELLDDKYVLDGPEVQFGFELLRREVPRRHRLQTYWARVQHFKLTYYSDFMPDEDEPFDGALCDDDAEWLARNLLHAFVKSNRLPQIGRYVEDDDVDGAETAEDYRRHKNEYTIYYTIIEDTGFTHEPPEKQQVILEEQLDGYERRAPQRTLAGDAGTAHEFFADVRWAIAESKRR